MNSTLFLICGDDFMMDKLFFRIILAKNEHVNANSLVPGVLVDALDGRGASGDSVHQTRVTVGEGRFSREPVGLHVQPRASHSVAASLVRQSAAVA